MRIIFLSYINRSGSTFFVNQLSKSPDICIAPESEELYNILLYNNKFLKNKYINNRLFKKLSLEKKFIHWGIQDSELQSIISESDTNISVFIKILKRYKEKHKSESKIIVFKHNNLFKIKLKLEGIESQIYYINLIRDPRAIYSSQIRTISPLTKNVMCNNAVELAKKWNRYMNYLNRTENNKKITIIRYDKLINNTAQVIMRISQEIGFIFDQLWINNSKGSMDKFLLPEYQKIHSKAKERAQTDNINNWKLQLQKSEIDIISTICRKYISEFNYCEIEKEYNINIFKQFIISNKLVKRVHVTLEKIRSINWLYKIVINIRSRFTKFNTKKLQTFFVFIGYPRSGHTLVGALLDAHPNITCSIEANILLLFKQGLKKKAIFYFVLKRSEIFVTKFKYKWTKYLYEFDGLYQGKSKNTIALGDKKGAGSTKILISNPNLLFEFEKEIRLPVKMLHIIRNSYDNIATIMLRAEQKGVNCTHEFFDSRIEYYFKHARTNQQIIKANPLKVLNIYHEDLISQPKEKITEILNFLNIPKNSNYLSVCANYIYSNPHKTRNKIDWPADLKEKVRKNITEIDFLKKYSWD